MADEPLGGRKVAVLVESQYVPEEIRCYQERFAQRGAEVHLMSRLWGQPKQTFVGEVEVPGHTPETLDVDIDIDDVDLDDYAGVIVAANYTSVRLRWNEDAATSTNPAEAVRNAPAARFFRRAMGDRRIVKGAPCHALWLLTPSPEVLAGRRVTCNPVVLADVLNAGALYVPAPDGSDWHEHVVVDGDLVTNMSAVKDGRPVGTERFVDAICERIAAAPPAPAPSERSRAR
jgi:putative intracellular protease/amidase